MIFVTGAAGFIGSHLVDRLLADGRDVLGLDNFDPFYDRAIKETNLAAARSNRRFRFVEGDVRNAAALEAAVGRDGKSIEGIVHLGARAGVRPSLADPLGYHDVNVGGTLQLLDLARRLGVKQFVLASSSSVYGVNPRVPWREDDRDLQPISPYASSKIGAETAGQAYSMAYGLRLVALRFFTVYGPRQRPDLAIAKFARLMRSGKPVPFYGDGSTKRDYTFIADIVDGVVRALTYTATRFEVINLGNHHCVSLAELVNAVGAALGIKPLTDPQPEQPGDVPQTWADISKARQLLGWEPRTKLADGLRAYREWLDSR